MTFRILSLDGGGIRGVMTASILEEIEKLVGSPLNQHFDLIAGTSTGSIVASGIAKGYAASKLLELYRIKGKRIFPYQSRWTPERIPLLIRYGLSAPKFSSDGLIEVLKEEFGDGKLSDLANLVLITSYDTQNRELIVFKNWRKDFETVPIWEACTCSASAPTFFPAHKLEIKGKIHAAIDGGVYANNPVGCVLAEAINFMTRPDKIQLGKYQSVKLPENVKDISILSIGTGKLTRPFPFERVERWGLVQWVVPLISVFMDGSDQTNNYVTSNLIATDDQYIRLQFPLDRSLTGKRLSDDIDDTSEENINNLIEATKVYMDRLPQNIKDNIKQFFG